MAKDEERPFIVAEISLNWRDGKNNLGYPNIAAAFEDIIEANRSRGYRLVDFSLARAMTGFDVMNETIVAVFKKGPRRNG